MFKKSLAVIFILTMFFSCSSEEKSIFIASGAGYKKPVMKICEEFTKQSGIKVSPIFGNMQTVSVQVKQSGQVGVLIGDRSFLENPTLGVKYEKYTALGEGKLVLAYSKKLEKVTGEDLASDRIARISMPDTQKAIYGRAAMEFLTNNGLYEKIQDKVIQAATVPMVSSYLTSGEVDAGFINLTDAIGIKKSIGGYTILEDGYSPIEIVAGSVKGFERNEEVKKFIAFIQSDRSREILDSFGL